MGTRENSWNTAETPSLRAFRTVKTVTGSPAISIEPLVGVEAPARIEIRVDLPAPFSPNST